MKNKDNMYGKVLWITGLSGAGKSTVAKKIKEELIDENFILLDGDELRELFLYKVKTKQNYDYQARLDIAFKYSKMCNFLANQKFNVIIATISLFEEIHTWNKHNIKNYFEVYIKVPLDELIKRDPKKIYANYFSGKVTNVAGLDLKIDEPKNPDLILDYNKESNIEKMSEIFLNKYFEKFRK